MSKLKIEDIKNEFKKSGWNLISNKYVNLKTDLQAECPEGHNCYVTYEKFRKGNYQCPICKQNSHYKSNDVVSKTKEYRILALDQASITSGWSVFDGENLIKYGSWTSSGENSTEKIAQTKQRIASIVEKWQPDQVVFEDIQLQQIKGEGTAVITYKKLAHLQGVLANYFYEINMPFDVVAPATWRCHSEIKGRSRTDMKKNAQIKIKKLYDVSVTQDEADAILIGRWATDKYKRRRSRVIEFT